MPRDVNLLLHNAAVSSDSQSTAISVVGGEFAVVDVRSTVTPTDSDETIDITIEASVDGGSSYFKIGAFPQFVKAANKGNAGTWVAVPVYIPRAQANPDARGVNTATKLRLNFDVGGTTPSFTIRAYVNHLHSNPFGSVAGFTSGDAGRYGPLDAIQNWDA